MTPALELCQQWAVRAGGIVARVRPAATAAALLAADAAALLAAAFAGAQLWSLVNPEIGWGAYAGLWPALALFLPAYAALGLYPGVGLSPVEELRRLALGATAVYLVLAVAIFLAKTVDVYSRGAFLASWLLSAALVPPARAAVRALFAARPWWGVPVLVLGAGKTGRMLIESLQARPGLGLKPVACLDDDPEKHGEHAGVSVLGPLARAPELGRALRIRHALVAMPGVSRAQLLEVLERWAAGFPHVLVIPDLFGMASLWVASRDLGGVLGLELRQNLLLPVNRWLKRALDVLLGGALGILAAPVVAIAALWIKRVNPGPALYEQEREGEGGHTIRVRKLRTMYLNADQLLFEHLTADENARREWQRCFKLKHDPRILPGVGRLLRRTSLDELPQLWNVLKGEMSLVGPRPFPYYHLEQFDRQFRRLRSKVRPGLTGLWQVSGRSDGDLKAQQKLDTYYIRNWSLWLDFYILARTVRAVLCRNGAY